MVDSTCSESEESDIQFADQAKADMDLSSSGSERSVDTDAESGVEIDEGPMPGDEPPPLAAAATLAPDSDDVDSASDDRGNVKLARHRAGTWTVLDLGWFYITQTPGYVDIKIHMKGPLQNITSGMGRDFMSRTLSPPMYMGSPLRSQFGPCCCCAHGPFGGRSCRGGAVPSPLACA